MSGDPPIVEVMRLEHALALGGRHWLHPVEAAELDNFRWSQRRNRWLAGRYLMKQTLLDNWNLAAAPAELCIESRTPQGLGAAPVAWLRDVRLPLAMSLSHSRWHVAVAAVDHRVHIGIDLVDPPSRGERALAGWFSLRELAAMGRVEPIGLRAAWSAKEAAFKTLAGESFRPRRIELAPRAVAEWSWTYRHAACAAAGRVAWRTHPEFALAIAQRFDDSRHLPTAPPASGRT